MVNVTNLTDFKDINFITEKNNKINPTRTDILITKGKIINFTGINTEPAQPPQTIDNVNNSLIGKTMPISSSIYMMLLPINPEK